MARAVVTVECRRDALCQFEIDVARCVEGGGGESLGEPGDEVAGGVSPIPRVSIEDLWREADAVLVASEDVGLGFHVRSASQSKRGELALPTSQAPAPGAWCSSREIRSPWVARSIIGVQCVRVAQVAQVVPGCVRPSVRTPSSWTLWRNCSGHVGIVGVVELRRRSEMASSTPRAKSSGRPEGSSCSTLFFGIFSRPNGTKLSVRAAPVTVLDEAGSYSLDFLAETGSVDLVEGILQVHGQEATVFPQCRVLGAIV